MSNRGPRDAVFRYHGRSTHRPDRFAPGPGGLDWANQPDPFRRFEGCPVERLPVPTAGSPTWDGLFGGVDSAIKLRAQLSDGTQGTPGLAVAVDREALGRYAEAIAPAEPADLDGIIRALWSFG